METRNQPDPNKFLLALSGIVADTITGTQALHLVADAALQHLACSYTGLGLMDSRHKTGIECRNRGRLLGGGIPEDLLQQSLRYWAEQTTATRWDYSTGAFHWSAWPLRRGRQLIGVLGAQWPVSALLPRLPGAQFHPLLKMAAVLLERALTIEELHHLHAELIDENQYLKEEIRQRFRPENFVWVSGAMEDLSQTALRVAASTATVLIHGETGTGKELLAHMIHEHSPRSRGPFIRVNCAALPDTLLESELFGHVKGAFTGATADRKGRFEAADGGTIFLDEIGDISQSLQIRLLRVLQEREIERVGEQQTRKINVRVITATHRRLEDEMAAGRFRDDLYYRLNVVYLFIPPLRERPDDILPLVEHFLSRYNRENLKAVQIKSAGVIRILTGYPWPGNVRQLQNCVEKAVILAPGDELTADLLPAEIATQNGDLAPVTPPVKAGPGPGGIPELIQRTILERKSSGDVFDHVLEQVEKPLLVAALAATRGNQLAASRLLGINRNTLREKLVRHNLLTPRPIRRNVNREA